METIKTLTKDEFKVTLAGFHGTESYYLHSLPNGISMQLTDGCEFIRQHAGGGAYWLFDLILSWQYKLNKEEFQVWKLKKQENDTWIINCEDGNKNVLATQSIPYSDFPLDEFEVWLTGRVCLLPSEY